MTPAKDLERLAEALCTIVKAVGISAGQPCRGIDNCAVLELVGAFDTVHEFIKRTQ